MERLKPYFLEAVGASIRGGRVFWQGQMEQEDLRRLLQLAQQHHVWALVAEAIFISPDAMDLYKAAEYFSERSGEIRMSDGRVIPAFCLD